MNTEISIWRKIVPKVKKSNRQLFEQETTLENFKRLRHLIFIALIIAPFFLLSDLYIVSHKDFLLSDSLFLLFNLIYLLLWYILNPKDSRAIRKIHLIYVVSGGIFIIVWIAFVSLIEYQSKQSFHTFIAGIFIISVFFYFKILILCFIYALGLIILYTQTSSPTDTFYELYERYFLFISLIPIALFNSILLYRTRIKAFNAQKSIAEINRNLKKEVVERKKSEENLQLLAEELDMRIKKRTKILAQANQALKDEITERKKAVLALRENEKILKKQNEQLRKVNAELDRFVYSTSHDLRAPLTSILGLIDISRQEANKEQTAHYLNLMEKSVRKLDNFIKDIINYSKNSRMEVQREKIDFQKIIYEIFDNHKYMDEHNKIETSIELELKSVNDFYTDSTRLVIILNNLISNAYRYSVPQKENPFIQVKIEVNEKNALIEIKDNGQGIGEEHLGKIFEMFYRASANSKGSGLGLYIVKETITTLKGKIKVESEFNVGTSFILDIPCL